MKNINLSNKQNVTIKDHENLYMVNWIHEEQKLLFKDISNSKAKIFKPNFTFENEMVVTVNSGIEYYENIYSLRRDESGRVLPATKYVPISAINDVSKSANSDV